MVFSIPNVTVNSANIGTIPNDGTGDLLRVGIQKINNSITNLANYSNTVGNEVSLLSNSFVTPNHINANYTIQTTDCKGILTVNTTTILRVTVPNTMPEAFTCEIVSINSGNVGIVTDNSSFLNGNANTISYLTPNVHYRLVMPVNSTGSNAYWYL